MTEPIEYDFILARIPRNVPVPSCLDVKGRGSKSAVTERILDSKSYKRHLTIINDAEHARGTLHAIRDRERDVKEREDAMDAREAALKHDLLQDTINKLDALTARMDSLEAARAHDPDDDELPLPPGSPMPDSGELESPKVSPSEDQNVPRLPVAEEA